MTRSGSDAFRAFLASEYIAHAVVIVAEKCQKTILNYLKK